MTEANVGIDLTQKLLDGLDLPFKESTGVHLFGKTDGRTNTLELWLIWTISGTEMSKTEFETVVDLADYPEATVETISELICFGWDGAGTIDAGFYFNNKTHPRWEAMIKTTNSFYTESLLIA